jgi:hypothetical protein
MIRGKGSIGGSRKVKQSAAAWLPRCIQEVFHEEVNGSSECATPTQVVYGLAAGHVVLAVRFHGVHDLLLSSV